MPEIKYNTLKNYLKDLKKDPKPEEFAPVYLIYGEELLYKRAFEDILRAVIPEPKMSLNYCSFEGTSDHVQEAIESVNTYSLLSGKKVVAINDSKIFYSKQNESDLLKKANEFFDKKDMDRAVKYLLNLLGILNLSFDDVSRENRSKTLRFDRDHIGDGEWIDQIISYCMAKNLTVPSVAGSDHIVQGAVEKGFPNDNHLIITADIVDKRRKLFKTINKKGMIIDCSIPKGDRKADKKVQKDALMERMSEMLDPIGGTIDRGATEILYEMTGFDLRTFSNNLQKLISYVGDRKKITAADVESVLNRTKKDPLYELTNAVSDRNIEHSLFFLNSLLSDNFHPLQILAAITNQIRRLLLVRGFLESPQGSFWKSGISFGQFKNRTIPAIQDYDRELLNRIVVWDGVLLTDAGFDQQGTKTNGSEKMSKPVTDLVILKNPKNPYPVYQTFLNSEKFTTEELAAALEALNRTDLRLKSTGQNPKIVLEEVVFRICRSKTSAKT